MKRFLGIFGVLVAIWLIVLVTFGGHSGKKAPTGAADPTQLVGHDVDPRKPDDEEEYLSKVAVYEVRGMMAHGTIECIDERCTAVAAKIRNDGARILKGVKVMASFPDKTGHTVYEQDRWVVSGETDPLKPGFIRKFGWVVPDCPSECVASKVTVKVTWVRFATD
jgi:hypothetical protein